MHVESEIRVLPRLVVFSIRAAHSKTTQRFPIVMIKYTSVLIVVLLASLASLKLYAQLDTPKPKPSLVNSTETATFKTFAYDITTYQGDEILFVIEPGISAAWYDPTREGEGFVVEILTADRAVMYWFTYDSEGRQDWYTAQGEIEGNRITFPELLQVSGGEFGPGFDPEKVTRTVVGSASFIWSSCDSGTMNWVIDQDGGKRQQGRMDLSRLSRLMGLSCGRHNPLPPERPEGQLSGSWYDPSHSGEGYVLEVLFDARVLVYWFSFDAEGNRRWFFGTGEIMDGKLIFDQVFTTLGGTFGSEFDPETVEVIPWGSLELELKCIEGTARFESEEEGFPAGTLDLTRLTILDGLACKF